MHHHAVFCSIMYNSRTKHAWWPEFIEMYRNFRQMLSSLVNIWQSRKKYKSIFYSSLCIKSRLYTRAPVLRHRLHCRCHRRNSAWTQNGQYWSGQVRNGQRADFAFIQSLTSFSVLTAAAAAAVDVNRWRRVIRRRWLTDLSVCGRCTLHTRQARPQSVDVTPLRSDYESMMDPRDAHIRCMCSWLSRDFQADSSNISRNISVC